MKLTKILMIITITFILTTISLAQSRVYGRAFSINQYGSQMPILRSYVALFDETGAEVAVTVTNSFGYYNLATPPNQYKYFVLVISNRTYSFVVPARIFNAAFDDGYGFEFNFVGYRNTSPTYTYIPGIPVREQVIDADKRRAPTPNASPTPRRMIY